MAQRCQSAWQPSVAALPVERRDGRAEQKTMVARETYRMPLAKLAAQRPKRV